MTVIDTDVKTTVSLTTQVSASRTNFSQGQLQSKGLYPDAVKKKY